jgi:hypothetical protein
LLQRLPAGSTVATATTAAVTTTTTAAATAAAVSTTAAVAAAASATEPTSTATAAATTILTRLGFVNRQVTSVDLFAIKLGDGSLTLFFRRHFDETEPARAAGLSIFDN